MARPVQIVVRGALLCSAVLVGGYAAAGAAWPTVVAATVELSGGVDGSGAAAAALSGVVVLAAAVALSSAWLWVLACVVSCVHDELRVALGTGARRAPSALRPRLVRLLVGGVLGSAVALSVSPAHATESDRHVDPIVVAGLLLPDRPAGAVPAPETPSEPTTGTTAETAAGTAPGAASGTPAAAPAETPPDPPAAPDPRPSAEPAPRSVTVSAGDTLWAIAETLLPPSATDADVDRTWRELHAANRDVVGPDPDVIVPGTVLTTTLTTALTTVPPAEGGTASTSGDQQ